MSTISTQQGNGHVPLRMCIVCRERLPKGELSRYVRAKVGNRLAKDDKQTHPGRGYYVCHRDECRKRFEKISLRK